MNSALLRRLDALARGHISVRRWHTRGHEEATQAIARVRVVVPGAPREPRGVAADDHDVEVRLEDISPAAARHRASLGAVGHNVIDTGREARRPAKPDG